MIAELLLAGLNSLREYVGAHVLTCLIPAFLLAGGIVRFVNREAIIDYLGERANKIKSFSLASFSSFFIAACSCTVIPVASGLYTGGAGVGVAFIVLWVAPASNILSLMYTGQILGGQMVIVRVAAALLMGFLVGTVMTMAFRHTAPAPALQTQRDSSPVRIVDRVHLILLALILASLLLPNYLIQTGSYGRKVLVWAVSTIILGVYAWRSLAVHEIKDWLREAGWFVRTIFPLLLAGVFIVGIVGRLIPEVWIQAHLGGNGVAACFYATMIGSISYFSTMTEAPFVHTLMNMGMGEGPALALLLTGPGLSLPNWIAIGRVFGVSKAFAYVTTIIILGTLAGWFFGNLVMK